MAEKRRGKLGFVLMLLAALALLGVLVCAQDGGLWLTTLLAQSEGRDADGYLSEYEARLGHHLSTPAPADAEAATAAPTEAGNAAPRGPAKPARAE